VRERGREEERKRGREEERKREEGGIAPVSEFRHGSMHHTITLQNWISNTASSSSSLHTSKRARRMLLHDIQGDPC
jgi:hypothetical protein